MVAARVWLGDPVTRVYLYLNGPGSGRDVRSHVRLLSRVHHNGYLVHMRSLIQPKPISSLPKQKEPVYVFYHTTNIQNDIIVVWRLNGFS